MNPIPLIPKKTHNVSHDVSGVLREAFQDILSGLRFPKNVAKNADEFEIESEDLEANSAQVVDLYDVKMLSDDMGRVENDIMVKHATCLKEKDFVEKDMVLVETVKLKRKRLLPELNKNDVWEYGLLERNDLMPSIPEMSMDFRINSTNQHRSPCPNNDNAKIDSKINRKITPSVTQRRKKEMIDCSRYKPDGGAFYQTLARKADRRRVTEQDVIFVAVPATVVFKEYETGIVYKKTFKLLNVTAIMQSFVSHSLSSSSFFTVAPQSSVTRIAPGMCAVFTVTYCTSVYKDVLEIFRFKTHVGCDVEVKFRSTRKPPLLMAFIFKNIQHFMEKCTDEMLDAHNQSRSLALNATVDCGSCLLGSQLTLNLILKNEGGHGCFFVVHEDDWLEENVTMVSKEMELTVNAFYIYPTHFEIQFNDFVLLNITFFPKHSGLEVEKVFLMCNNNTLEELELIGDGVLFDSSSITIGADFKLTNMFNSDACSTYVIKFGKCIPYEKYLRTITVHNNSVVDFKYKWIIRESVCHIKGCTLRKMDSDWITMHKSPDYLLGYSTSDFVIELECKTKHHDYYSLVFILYILDVPEISLADDKMFFVTEDVGCVTAEANATKTVNVLVGEVEVLCEVTPISLQIDPENIIIPYTLSLEESYDQSIQIYTEVNSELKCEWTPFNTNAVCITPNKFFLRPTKACVCNVNISVHSYEDIRQVFSLVVNDGLLIQEYNVMARVQKPFLRFSQNFLNFGYLPIRKQTPSKEFFIENVWQEGLDWKIFEFYFDQKHNTIRQLKASKHLSATSGYLCRNEKSKVTYQIDNTDKQHRWLSFLVLMTSYGTLVASNSLCMVSYEVTQQEVVIHTKYSNLPILCPNELLHVNCESLHKICLHNVGRKLTASFIWGRPVGRHAENIKLTVWPRSGIVPPECCAHMSVRLEPLTVGILDDIYLPCFVGQMKEPLMLTVLCLVNDVRVHLVMPKAQNRWQILNWPPYPVADCGSFSMRMSDLEKESEEKSKQVNEEYQLNTSENDVNEVEHDDEEHQLNTSDMDLMNEVELNTYYPDMSDTNSEDDKTQSVPSTTLKDSLGSGFILHERFIEFCNVPLRTPVKKTVFIENQTPVVAIVKVVVANFHSSYNEDSKEDLLVRLNLKKHENEWERSVNENYGIVVRTTLNKDLLSPFDVVQMDIWVYANTWGIYVEEIIIKINNIIPFCFNLLIEVVGLPIAYPVTLNTEQNDPVIRFGHMPYLSASCQRKLKLTNFSCIPIYLFWHVFVNEKLEQQSFELPPFNVITESTFSELISKDKDRPLQLLLTKDYYGKEDFNIFTVCPQEMIIRPKTTETITITLNMDYFKASFENVDIQANLIGQIRLVKEYMYLKDLFLRHDMNDIEPAKAKILATIELPLLKLELVKGEKQIKTYANDIIREQEIRYKKVLVLRNVNSAPAEVYMHITSPFKVECVKTAQSDGTESVQNTPVTVQPGECIEVVLECIIDAEEVLKYSDMLYNEKTTVFSEIVDFKYNSITLLRYLNIHQHGIKKQITSMELTIYYPKIKVSARAIDFGVVYIGNTKKMFITLTNLTGSGVPFTIQKSITSNAISIIPGQDTIPKAVGSTPSSIMLSLCFVPSECKYYRETIQILTNMPFYYFKVELMGNGTNDEIFNIEGT